MDNFDKFKNKRYEDIEVPEGIGKNIFELAEKRKNEEILKKKKILNNVLKVAASFVIVLGLTGVIYFNLNKGIDEENIVGNNTGINENNYAVVNYEKKVEDANYLIFKPDFVSVIKYNGRIDSTNFSGVKSKFIDRIITYIDYSIENNIYGNLEEHIKLYIYGGVISKYDFERGIENNPRNYEYIQDSVSDEEKKKELIEVVTPASKMQAKPEIGKIYLVCLHEDNELYEGYGCYGKYGFVEYDETTGKVKNVETGNWEDIDPNILDLNSLK